MDAEVGEDGTRNGLPVGAMSWVSLIFVSVISVTESTEFWIFQIFTTVLGGFLASFSDIFDALTRVDS